MEWPEEALTRPQNTCLLSYMRHIQHIQRVQVIPYLVAPFVKSSIIWPKEAFTQPKMLVSVIAYLSPFAKSGILWPKRPSRNPKDRSSATNRIRSIWLRVKNILAGKKQCCSSWCPVCALLCHAGILWCGGGGRGFVDFLLHMEWAFLRLELITVDWRRSSPEAYHSANGQNRDNFMRCC